jgi:hypothetical protein
MSRVLEKSVYRLVVAEVGDYDRMKRKVESGNLTREQIISFTRKISAIENAICAVCDGESERAKSALISDIANERGYIKACSKEYYASRSTFDRRKNEAIEMIAAMLGLV